MSPLVAYHATNRKCRESIRRYGLLGDGCGARPFGVYVFGQDWQHVARHYIEWGVHPRQDLWRVAYIGPLCEDIYVLNGMILLDPPVHHVTLVTGN